MEIIQLNVPGITCDGWVVTIRMAVGRLQGVGKIGGEVKSKTVTVEFEPSTLTVKAVQEALKRLGYESTQLT